MRETLVATRNPGKFREIEDALGMVGFKLISLKDFEDRISRSLGDPLEDGDTFQENAYKKAKYFIDKVSGGGLGQALVLAEDSGILVDALAGELGVKTRRWGAGEKVSDEEWIDYFLKKMADVPKDKRGARFICCACLIYKTDDGQDSVKYFEGETEGFITARLEAPLMAGVPLSSCFKPNGFNEVYSALSIENKNRISHRGKAMARVREFFRGSLDFQA